MTIGLQITFPWVAVGKRQKKQEKTYKKKFALEHCKYFCFALQHTDSFLLWRSTEYSCSRYTNVLSHTHVRGFIGCTTQRVYNARTINATRSLLMNCNYVVMWYLLVSKIVIFYPIYTICFFKLAVFNMDFNEPIFSCLI